MTSKIDWDAPFASVVDGQAIVDAESKLKVGLHPDGGQIEEFAGAAARVPRTGAETQHEPFAVSVAGRRVTGQDGLQARRGWCTSVPFALYSRPLQFLASRIAP